MISENNTVLHVQLQFTFCIFITTRKEEGRTLRSAAFSLEHEALLFQFFGFRCGNFFFTIRQQQFWRNVIMSLCGFAFSHNQQRRINLNFLSSHTRLVSGSENFPLVPRAPPIKNPENYFAPAHISPGALIKLCDTFSLFNIFFRSPFLRLILCTHLISERNGAKLTENYAEEDAKLCRWMSTKWFFFPPPSSTALTQIFHQKQRKIWKEFSPPSAHPPNTNYFIS